MVKLMKQGTTIKSEVCYKTQKTAYSYSQQKACDADNVALLYDNVHSHTAASNHALLEHFNWKLSNNLLYNSNLTLGNHHLFTYSGEELTEGVKMCLSSQVTEADRVVTV